jgi:Protein of unknown function (DUF1592)/Protein of unknown function (DUF1588)/Protein of unknown function (DUF1595)/Protein of unknown function (DUF1585)/Protein of unknown function (DUF1587)
MALAQFRQAWSWFGVACIASAVGVSCTGTSGTMNLGPSSGNSAGSGSAGGSGSDSASGSGAPARSGGSSLGPDGGLVTTPSMIFGPTSGRRLTRDEYLNTIGDVFGSAVATEAAGIATALDGPPPILALLNDIAARTIQDQFVTEYSDVATAVATNAPWLQLASYASCTTDLSTTCQNDFINKLGRLMYRRPLTSAEVTNLGAVYTGTAANPGPNDPLSKDPTPFQTGSRLVVQAMLMSPNFLYQLETQQGPNPAPPTPYEIATRLAMLLWKAGPDAALLDAAAAGNMASPASISAQMTTMLGDPRARRGAREFADDWLGVYSVPARTQLPALNLTGTALADMRTETLRFFERLAFDDKADLMQLFLNKKTEISPELAKLYCLTPIDTMPTAVYDLSANPNRIGLLTQGATLGVRAGPAAASIAQRGHWVMNTLLCADVGPVPPAAAAAANQAMAMLPPTAPERAFFALHETFGPTCGACHREMDPMGFPFLTYDVAGAYVTKDVNGNVLDPSGTLNLDGTAQPYNNVADFAALLAKSPTVEKCLVHKYVQYFLGRNPTTPEDVSQVDSVGTAFHQQGRQFSQLVSLVVASPALTAPARDMFP